MTYRAAVRNFKRELVTRTIKRCGGVTAAARELQIDRTYLHRLCRDLSLPRTAHRGNWGSL